ncbi:SRPBCC domain-containing protein [Subtercola sp. YIM 133946]|uniref:SRPBCC domain-containing protein n=1 Tax=Subtercola sp. YIM 133946 TaxID=3118909 RepID=UPI002F950D4D
MTSELQRVSVSTGVDDRTTVVIERDFSASADRLWQALTDPGELRMWAPHTAETPLDAAGPATLVMLADGVGDDQQVPIEVLVVKPPHLLKHTWGPDVLRWEITADVTTDGLEALLGDVNPAGGDEDESGSVLVLRHTLGDPVMVSAVAAGWQLCFDVLETVLAGHPEAPRRGVKALDYGWNELNEQFAAELGVKPSVVFPPE